MVRIGGGKNPDVFAFYREKDGNIVVSIHNLSKEKQQLVFDQNSIAGEYTNVFTGEKTKLEQGLTFDLKPWEYLVFTK
jgi:RIO-like serine/threonine protein kinase